MSETAIPFLSIISTFSNNKIYNREIQKDLIQLIPALEDYINVKLTSRKLVCKSFISHLTRLLERIYVNELIQGEQHCIDAGARIAFHKHHKNLQTIFHNIFPDKNLELTSYEIYLLVLYILRLKKELA
ncbi:hypothetical protein [Niallia endozanthoxylica]|uniref:PRD domain-containing protein n=1 Tax=Niallia endozanthoxylica TaxID=2036016 RepID=A0A5J5HKF8_9BACI|nr:hypothetical protein [Niallia endozanthoxylica]KAA9021045.1 hypothetical protein F4V44_18040 [Niallia endozanthoxylica]